MSLPQSTTNAVSILCLNAGSSSLKAALFCRQKNSCELQLIATASVSDISTTSKPSSFVLYPPPPPYPSPQNSSHPNPTKISSTGSTPIKDHATALSNILSFFFQDKRAIDHLVKCNFPLSPKGITHVAHRVVHGAWIFTRPVILSKQNIRTLHKLTALAPLHNDPAEKLIRTAWDQLGQATQIAFFDTAFHYTLKEEVFTYPLPLEMCRKRHIRKYGFHGLSYQFVYKRVESYLRESRKGNLEDDADFKVTILHLGSGASACAINGGKSIETSMGFTPVDGLMMSTRPGNIDCTALYHLFDDPKSVMELLAVNDGDLDGQEKNQDSETQKPYITKAEDFLNHKCGFFGITGTASVESVIQMAEREGKSQKIHLASEDEPHPAPATLALNMFLHRIRLVIGAYSAALCGLDAIVFTGGTGAKWAQGRERVCEGLEYMGIVVDKEKNGEDQVGEGKGIVWDVTKERGGNRVRILVVETDEEREMAEGVIDMLNRAGS